MFFEGAVALKPYANKWFSEIKETSRTRFFTLPVLHWIGHWAAKLVILILIAFFNSKCILNQVSRPEKCNGQGQKQTEAQPQRKE